MMGHVTGFSQPELGSWSFTYGSIGNVTAYTDGQSQTFTNLRNGVRSVRP